MRISRIYQQVELKEGSFVKLDDRAFHYIVNVLRLSAESKIILFNGFGGEYTGYVDKITKKSAYFFIENFHEKNTESHLAIHLVQCISKSDHMDFAIQKAVELGVSEITPLITERCSFDNNKMQKKLAHWNGIIISACEQSGRTVLPKLNNICEFKKWIDLESLNTSTKIICDQSESKTLLNINPNPKSIIVLIGPEGGLSDIEIQTAKKHGFISINLGKRTLRTETAAMAVVACAQLLWGM